jgi:hypothetical protein
MTRPPQEALLTGAVIVAVPWVLAAGLGMLRRPVAARFARLTGWAALVLVASYLWVDSVFGFGSMAGLEIGIAVAVVVGLLLAWRINRASR